MIAQMLTPTHYVPILKWKQGEYQALSRLADATKDRITPLIEIPPIGYDHEKEAPAKSLEGHLSSFGNRLKTKWGVRRFFLDSYLLGYEASMPNGQLAIGYLLGSARANQCAAIPVIRLDCPGDILGAVAASIKLDQRGACIRLIVSDFDDASFKERVEAILKELGVGKTECDLVIDFAEFGYPAKLAFVSAAIAMLEMVPALNQWRSLTIAGTSFPSSLSQIIKPRTCEMLPRKEWITYVALLGVLGDTSRIPNFGDYGASHPDVLSLDMRLVKPLAKLRYTTSDGWFVCLGNNVRSNGFSQYQEMCQILVAQPFFDGQGFSMGDNYISGCATGAEDTGNLSTWIWVATNRHLTKVVSDLANQFGTSG